MFAQPDTEAFRPTIRFPDTGEVGAGPLDVVEPELVALELVVVVAELVVVVGALVVVVVAELVVVVVGWLEVVVDERDVVVVVVVRVGAGALWRGLRVTDAAVARIVAVRDACVVRAACVTHAELRCLAFLAAARQTIGARVALCAANAEAADTNAAEMARAARTRYGIRSLIPRPSARVAGHWTALRLR